MKALRSVLLAVLMLMLVTFPAIAGDEATQGDIVINEFMADPAMAPDADGEWIEIVNVTGDAINIDGWTLEDAAGHSHIISNGGTLNVAPHAYVALCIDDDSNNNGGVSCDYDYADSVTLNNDGDTITLKDPSGDIIARRVYSSSVAAKSWFYIPSGQPPANGYYYQDQQDDAQWAKTDDVAGNQYGDGDYGTPGARNEQTGEGGTPTAITLSALSASSAGLPLATVAFSALALAVSVVFWRQRKVA